MKSLAPQLSALELKDLLLASTDPVSSLNGITVTGGRLNAFNSIFPLQGSLLKVDSFVIEMTSGNGDDYINPGESGDFVFTLINSGTEPALNGSATINPTSPNSEITLTSNSVSIGDLNPGLRSREPLLDSRSYSNGNRTSECQHRK